MLVPGLDESSRDMESDRKPTTRLLSDIFNGIISRQQDRKGDRINPPIDQFIDPSINQSNSKSIDQLSVSLLF